MKVKMNSDIDVEGLDEVSASPSSNPQIQNNKKGKNLLVIL